MKHPLSADALEVAKELYAGLAATLQLLEAALPVLHDSLEALPPPQQAQQQRGNSSSSGGGSGRQTGRWLLLGADEFPMPAVHRVLSK